MGRGPWLFLCVKGSPLGLRVELRSVNVFMHAS